MRKALNYFVPAFVLLTTAYIFLLKKSNSDFENVSLANWKEIPESEFRQKQLQFERVRDAFALKEDFVKRLLTQTGIHSFDNDLFLRAFKKEEILEVWAKPKSEKQYRLVKTYTFCKNSGDLGAKRKEGDRQIPEGFYRISHFNPKSNYLLSLKINYPNASDKILSDAENMGGDIYIHGGCQTIGCIPITNEGIQELYILSVEAHRNNQRIPIHIFPSKNMEALEKSTHFSTNTKSFWKTLKPGFYFFEENKKLPKVKVLGNGNYQIHDNEAQQ